MLRRDSLFLAGTMAKRPRRKAAFTQADVRRTIRAAKAEGATEIEVRIGDEARIVVRMASSTATENTPEQTGEIIL
jgi:hypothetical protein